MSPTQALAKIRADLFQCDILIADAHHQPSGTYSFSAPTRQQISKAALLNLFIAWEEFLENMMISVMTGNLPINGNSVTLYVTPNSEPLAKSLITGTLRYFDFSNHDNVRKLCRDFFYQGYPFDGPLSASFSTLSDLKTMRNACAHISSSTQRALEGVANRIFSSPRPNIDVYALITAIDPRSTSRDSVFKVYRDQLEATAAAIAHG